MMNRWMVQICWIGFVFGLGMGTVPALAQSPETINISEIQQENSADKLRLYLYFTGRDADGHIITDLSPRGATVTVNNQPYEAQIEEPTTELFLVLALDASGSMEQAADEMRAAAIAAVESTPAETQIMVIQFNEFVQVLTQFTTNRAEVIRAIESVQPENSGTCLYYALYSAIDEAQRATSGASSSLSRRAVIIFTDGRDEKTAGQGDACSEPTYGIGAEDVFTQATQRESVVPLYTIGLLGENGASEQELQEFANKTGGVSASGDRGNLQTLFQGVMQGLASQLVAIAEVYTQPGENVVVLTLSRGDEPSLVDSGTFIDEVGHLHLAAPVAVLDVNLIPDLSQQLYTVEILAENEESVTQWKIQIEQANNTIQENLFEVQTKPYQFSYQSLSPGENYELVVYGLDGVGESLKNERGEIVLFADQFAVPESVALSPQLLIEPVEISPTGTVLTVTVRMANVTEVASWSVTVINGETKALVDKFVPALGATGIFTISTTGLNAGNYQILLEGASSEGQLIVAAAQEVKFAPESCTFFCQLSRFFRQNPYVLLVIGIVVLIGVGVGTWQWKRSRIITDPDMLRVKSAGKKPNQNNPPPITQTELGGSELDQFFSEIPSSSQKLTLRVVQSSDPLLKGQTIPIQQFPFTLGREQSNLNFPSERLISRQHAQILYENGIYYLEDRGSTNGTFLNEQKITSRTPFAPPAKIRLGAAVWLELFSTEQNQ